MVSACFGLPTLVDVIDVLIVYPASSTKTSPAQDASLPSAFWVFPGLARLDALFAFYDAPPSVDSRLQSLSTQERRSLRADILSHFADDTLLQRVLRLDHSLRSFEHQREVLDRMITSLRVDLDQAAREASPSFATFVTQWLKDHPSPAPAAPTETAPPVEPPAAVAPPVIATAGPTVIEEDAVSLDFDWDPVLPE